jgi:lipopolysaccharide transport system permease protein
MRAVVDVGFETTGERTKLVPLVRDVWRARDLMAILAKKDFYVRYRRASIGLLWAIGLPLIQSVILAIIFSKIVTVRGTGIPYSVYVLSGMVPWTFFSGTISGSTTSIVDGSSLASRVYFPRATLPIMNILSGVRAYIPSLVVLIGIAAAILRGHLGVHLLLIVPATLMMLSLALGFSMVLSGLHVYFRDVRYIVQATIFPWFFVSGVIIPVLGPRGLAHKIGRVLYANPAIGFIQMYRAAFGSGPAWNGSELVTLYWIIGLMAIALPMYQRHDRNFVDRL